MGKDKRRNITNKPVPYGFDHEENTENNIIDGSHFEPYKVLNSRPVLNYDFFNTYLEYKELDKKYSSGSVIDTAGFDNYELYKLKMNYPLSRRERNNIRKKGSSRVMVGKNHP